ARHDVSVPPAVARHGVRVGELSFVGNGEFEQILPIGSKFLARSPIVRDKDLAICICSQTVRCMKLTRPAPVFAPFEKKLTGSVEHHDAAVIHIGGIQSATRSELNRMNAQHVARLFSFLAEHAHKFSRWAEDLNAMIVAVRNEDISRTIGFYIAGSF